jgi:hypothetical protein
LPIASALLVGLGALLAGILVAWATTLIPGIFAEPEPSPSPSPSVTAPDPGTVVVPTLQPILRDLDPADLDAGVTTLDFTYQGAGTFTIVPGEGEPVGSAPVRWVSIAVEDGIEADPSAFARFILAALNDNRGWGSEQRMQFVQTDGVADYKILLASPFTAAAICPDNHVAAIVGPVMEATPSADAEAPATADPGLSAGDEAAEVDPEARNPACALEGEIVISMYEWSAGFVAFGQDRTAARQYIAGHQLGHLFGHEESECASGLARVMDNQRVEMPQCEANPWPFPEAEVGVAATSQKSRPPVVSPSPTP